MPDKNTLFSITEFSLGRKLTEKEKNNILEGVHSLPVQSQIYERKQPCTHRSKESIRTETCPSCSGNISIKIFSCTLHKECCLSNKLPLIKNCNTCEDYELPKPT